jgi:hypothetical protein
MQNNVKPNNVKPNNVKPNNVKPNNNAKPTTYVSPAMRFKNTAIAAPSTGTKKTALKKEFAIDDQMAFPTLATTIKKPELRGTPISFSSAASKKIEAPVVVKLDVLPGWVLIRRLGGQIQYKYGKPILRNDEEERRAEEIKSRIILNNRIAREQYDRDREIERLGDLSEFYGQLTLVEMFENDLLVEESDSSDYNSEPEWE